MNRILIDSSFLFSLYSPKDPNYRRSQAFAAQPGFVAATPEVVMTEAAFLFRRMGGIPALAIFLERFAKRSDQPILTTLADYRRAAEIMTTYRTTRLDFVDCVIMALSERLAITQVCTYDRRDFAIFRPTHCPFLELLP